MDELNNYTLLLIACVLLPIYWIFEGVIMWLL